MREHFYDLVARLRKKHIDTVSICFCRKQPFQCKLWPSAPHRPAAGVYRVNTAQVLVPTTTTLQSGVWVVFKAHQRDRFLSFCLQMMARWLWSCRFQVWQPKMSRFADWMGCHEWFHSNIWWNWIMFGTSSQLAGKNTEHVSKRVETIIQKLLRRATTI